MPRDRQWLAYDSVPEGTLWRSKVDGIEQLQLTFSPLRNFLPRWSPDGNSLTFGMEFGVAGFPEKASVNVLDLKTHQISSLPGSKGLFSSRWSPDGRYIVAQAIDQTKPKLMIFDFTTNKWQDLIESTAGYFDWSRNGRYIYLNSTTGDPAFFGVRISDHDNENWRIGS